MDPPDTFTILKSSGNSHPEHSPTILQKEPFRTHSGYLRPQRGISMVGIVPTPIPNLHLSYPTDNLLQADSGATTKGQAEDVATIIKTSK